MNDKVVFDNKTYCLSLAYHMYGSGMGTISIYTYNTNLGLLKKQFSVNGTQGKEWHKVDIDLPLDRKTRLIIMSVRGKSYQSDIAIDDVTLMPRPCSA
ncbi:MAM domain-containing protein 2-like [Saccostrea echinata]|uniref:MAM domain-containing protein 2-like n=1 Tax=Saccostrea echinata TaxID=191078 RepID=UPI002A830941|nr:MAM domain-containing protein 2-like [Saccostrea echinata]